MKSMKKRDGFAIIEVLVGMVVFYHRGHGRRSIAVSGDFAEQQRF